MRFRRYFLAAFLVVAAPQVLAQNDDPETCRVSSDVEAGIEACNRVINSGRYTRRELARAYVDRGQKYYVLKNHDQAIRDASRAIELGSAMAPIDLAIAYSNRGNGYFVTNQVDRAIADYTAAIRTYPDFAAPYTARGLMRERKGESEAALADFRAALRAPRGDFEDDDWAKSTAQNRIDHLTNR